MSTCFTSCNPLTSLRVSCFLIFSYKFILYHNTLMQLEHLICKQFKNAKGYKLCYNNDCRLYRHTIPNTEARLLLNAAPGWFSIQRKKIRNSGVPATSSPSEELGHSSLWRQILPSQRGFRRISEDYSLSQLYRWCREVSGEDRPFLPRWRRWPHLWPLSRQSPCRCRGWRPWRTACGRPICFIVN